MDRGVKKDKGKNSNAYQQGRPISDYFLSKARKEIQSLQKTPEKSLYQDALERKLRQESLIKAADESAKQSANQPKLTKKSQKLFEYKRVKEIEDVILQFEDPPGFISRDNLCKILENLLLILPENYKFKTLKSKVQNMMQEQALLSNIWSFLSPPNDDFIIKELIYDLLSILMDKNCELSAKIEDLRRLKTCIEAVNESSPTNTEDHSRLIKEFDSIMDRRKVLGFHRQQERLKNEVLDFSFQPEIIKGKGGEVVGLERCEALYRNYQEKEDKILCSKLTALEKELDECTFTPAIISGRICRTEAKPPKEKEKSPGWKEKQEEIDLRECTFKPRILKESRQIEWDKPRGFEKSVKLMRRGQMEKLLKADREKISIGENYERLKNLGSCPPSFLTREKDHREIIMYVDVNLGMGKKGKVALRAGDDPKVVAENFCKIYQLGKDYEITLEEELKDQLKDIETILE